MRIKRPGKEEPKRVTQAELGRLFGVSRKTISEWAAKRSFPAEQDGWYSAFEVFYWYTVEHIRSLVPREVGDLSETDPLLATGDGSPALERYREERAKLAALDRKTREKELIVLGTIREYLGRFSANIRSAGRALQKAFGTEASRILEDALTDSEREISQVCGDRDLYSNS